MFTKDNSLFQHIKKIFISNSKSQEILFLLHNKKPAVRQGFYSFEINKVKEWCEQNKLFCVESKFRVLLLEDGFTNKGIRVKDTDPSGMVLLYISKNEQLAYLANYYELIEEHKELGLLLGYPSCCCDYFTRVFSTTNTNPVHKPTNPYTNILLREQDLVLISHFPCSSECVESIQIGKENLTILQQDIPELARLLLSSLESSLL